MTTQASPITLTQFCLFAHSDLCAFNKLSPTPYPHITLPPRFLSWSGPLAAQFNDSYVFHPTLLMSGPILTLFTLPDRVLVIACRHVCALHAVFVGREDMDWWWRGRMLMTWIDWLLDRRLQHFVTRVRSQCKLAVRRRVPHRFWMAVASPCP